MYSFTVNKDESLARQQADSQHTPSRTTKKIVVWLCLVVLLGLGVGLGLFAVSSQKPNQAETLPSSVVSAVNFPLYYPKPLPAGWQLNANSPNVFENNVINFSLNNQKAASQVVITEQRKPPVIEEVTKTKKFKTSLGDAYLADLNGHTAGFILADKTLIILSTSGHVADDQLVAIMQNMSAI